MFAQEREILSRLFISAADEIGAASSLAPRFDLAAQSAAQLAVRLFQRKGPWFRLSQRGLGCDESCWSLGMPWREYPEITAMDPAVLLLRESGLLWESQPGTGDRSHGGGGGKQVPAWPFWRHSNTLPCMRPVCLSHAWVPFANLAVACRHK